MANDRQPFCAAAVQLRGGVNRPANVEAASQLIDDAAEEGAQFVVTPEMTNVLDREPERMFADLPGEDGLEEISAFADVARRNKIWLLIGSMAVRTAERRAANRSILYSPTGEIVARYDKLHMFDVQLPKGETWRESNVYEPGDEAVVVEAPFAKLGLSICYDVRFPALYRLLAQAGANVLCVPAAFTKQTGEAHWKTLLRARAIECGAFVIAAAQGGHHEDGRDTYGHSMIVGPWGEVITEAQGDKPGFVIGEIDLANAEAARARIPNLRLEKVQDARLSRISCFTGA